MANAFDRFDVQGGESPAQPAGNPFDAFDEVAEPKAPKQRGPSPASNAGRSFPEAKPSANGQRPEGYDSFVEATGKSLDNVPERLQQSFGGLVQMLGEDVGQERERFTEQSAQRLGITPNEYKALAWAGNEGIIDPETPVPEALESLKSRMSTDLTPDQQAQVADMGLINPERVADKGRDLRKDAQSTMKSVNAEPGSPEYYTSAAIGSIAEMTPALLASAITRSPAAGMSIIGGQVGGESYGTGRDEGLSIDESQQYALAQAAAEAIPEYLPIATILKPGKNFFAKLGKTAVAESLQETVTAGLQAGIDKGTIRPDMTWGEARSLMADSAIIGGIAGPGMAAMMEPVVRLRNRQAQQDAPPGEPAPPVVQQDPEGGAPEAETASSKPANPFDAFDGPAPTVSAVEAAAETSAGDGQPVSRNLQREPAGEVSAEVQSDQAAPVVADPVSSLPEPDQDVISRRFSDPQTRSVAAQVFERVRPSTSNQREVVAIDMEANGDQGDIAGPRVQVLDSLRQTLNSNKALRSRLQSAVPDAGQSDRIPGLTATSSGSMNLIASAIRQPEINGAITRAAQRIEQGEGRGAVIKDLRRELDAFDPDASTPELAPKDPATPPLSEIAPEQQPTDDDGSPLENLNVDAPADQAEVATEQDAAEAERQEVIRRAREQMNQTLQAGDAQFDAPVATDDRARPEITPVDQEDALSVAAAETDTNPTDAQKEAGNYRKAKVRIQGLEIAIENPKGSTRSGTDPDGKKWESTMAHHYGDLKGTKAADGDNLDVFIGPDPDIDQVFVIDQPNSDGSFDEHKILLGFKNEKAAKEGYLANYEKGWKVGPITRMSIDDLKSWMRDGDTTKPLAEAKPDQEPQAERVAREPEAQSDSVRADQESDKDNIMLYSRGGRSPQSPLPVNQVRRTVDEFLRRYKGADDVDVRIHETAETLPGYNADRDASAVIQGQYDSRNDRLHLVARAFGSRREIRQALQEEILVHKGLGFFSPVDRQQLYSDIQRAADENPDVRALWEQTLQDYRPVAETYNLNEDQANRLYAEELLGSLAQRDVNWLARGWRRVRQAIKRLMVKAGWARNTIGADELRSRIDLVAKAFERGQRARRRNFTQDIRDGESDTETAAQSRTEGETESVSPDAVGNRGVAAGLNQGDEPIDAGTSSRTVDRSGERGNEARVEGGRNATDEVEIPAFSRVGNRLEHAADHFDDLDTNQRSALGKIAPKTPREKAADWLAERLDRWATKLRQGIVDRFAALKDVDEALYGQDVVEGSTASSSWVLAQMAGAASGALQSMLTTSRIKLNTKEGVISLREDSKRGLNDTLKQLGTAAEIERFFGWIAGNRSARLMEGGRENLFTPEEVDALKRLNEGKTESGQSRRALYSKVFRQFQEYRDDVLEIAAQTGIITREQRETWANEFYVPFYRLADKDGGFTGPKSSGGISRQEAYKRLKGGKENLNDLLENTMMNFHHLLQASLKNQAALQAMENSEDLGIAREVREAERTPENSTFVLREGRKIWYEIDDPLVFKAVSALSHPGMNSTMLDVMRKFKRLFTNMITTTPTFILRNLIRDTLQALATSPVAKNPARNAMMGAKVYGNGRTRAQMMASGGSFSFGHLYGENADEMRLQITGALGRAEVLRSPSMVPATVKALWRQWNNVTDFTENVNRAAIYAQNLEERGDLYAAFQARDLMNFSQYGSWPAVRILIDVVPFMNARLQGLDKIYRTGVKPAFRATFGQGSATDAQIAKRFWAVAGTLALASIANYLRNYDDEEYQRLEEWQKDTYWFVRLADDHAIFIPKPFEVGAIATMAERVTEQFVNEKATGDLFRQRLGHMLTDTFSFSPVPQVAAPLLDIYSNYDAFTGRPIESQGMQGMRPSLRMRPTTTEPAKWASSGVEMLLGPDSSLTPSPVQVDHLIQGYFGSVGSWLSGIGDTIIKGAQGDTEPAKRWYEHNPIRSFYKNLGDEEWYTRYGTVFYDALQEVNRVHTDIRKYRELENHEAADELRDRNLGILSLRRKLNRTQKDLSDINKRMDRVNRAQKSAEWKRRELDRYKAIRNRIQEQAGRLIEEVRAKED